MDLPLAPTHIMPQLESHRKRVGTLEGRSGEIEEKIDQIQVKQEDHDEYFIRIHDKLEDHDKQFVKIDQRFVRIETILDHHSVVLDEHSSTLDLIKRLALENAKRIDILEDTVERGFERMDRGFSELKGLILSYFG